MIIETKDFGSVEIDEKEIISFPNGIYGFEKYHNFVLLSDNKEDNPFMWLQCTDSREPRFVVIDPLKMFSDYSVSLGDAAQLISLKDETDLRLLSITTVTKGAKAVYVNLKCPVILNARDNIAAQIVLENSVYPIRYYLYNKEG